jgi:hypothetical protein
MAEGEVLGANSLGGEERSADYDCVNRLPEQLSKGYAALRQAETGRCSVVEVAGR